MWLNTAVCAELLFTFEFGALKVFMLNNFVSFQVRHCDSVSKHRHAFVYTSPFAQLISSSYIIRNARKMLLLLSCKQLNLKSFIVFDISKIAHNMHWITTHRMSLDVLWICQLKRQQQATGFTRMAITFCTIIMDLS